MAFPVFPLSTQGKLMDWQIDDGVAYYFIVMECGIKTKILNLNLLWYSHIDDHVKLSKYCRKPKQYEYQIYVDWNFYFEV